MRVRAAKNRCPYREYVRFAHLPDAAPLHRRWWRAMRLTAEFEERESRVLPSRAARRTPYADHLQHGYPQSLVPQQAYKFDKDPTLLMLRKRSQWSGSSKRLISDVHLSTGVPQWSAADRQVHRQRRTFAISAAAVCKGSNRASRADRTGSPAQPRPAPRSPTPRPIPGAHGVSPVPATAS